MILWHLGIATLIVYATLGRRRIDYRFVLAGAVAPDAVDGALDLWVFSGPDGRWVAHSLAAVIAVTVVILLAARGEMRQRLFGIGVGWLLHLVADGMWREPLTFLWPAFGVALPTTHREPYSWDLFVHPAAHLGTWGTEAIGLAVLAWFFVAFRLGHDGRLGLFLRDGYLRP